MKKTILLPLFLFTVLFSIAQDTLFLKDNRVVTGKIERIKKNKIIIQLDQGLREVDRANVTNYVWSEDTNNGDSLLKPVTSYWSKYSIGTQFFAPGGGLVYYHQIDQSNWFAFGNLQFGQVRYHTPVNGRSNVIHNLAYESYQYYDGQLRNELGFKLGIRYSARENYHRFRPYTSLSLDAGISRVYKCLFEYAYYGTTVYPYYPADIYTFGIYYRDEKRTYTGGSLQVGFQQAITTKLNISVGVELMIVKRTVPGQETRIDRKDGSKEHFTYPDKKQTGYLPFFPVSLVYNLQ